MKDSGRVTGYAEVIPTKPERTITSGLPTTRPRRRDSRRTSDALAYKGLIRTSVSPPAFFGKRVAALPLAKLGESLVDS